MSSSDEYVHSQAVLDAVDDPSFAASRKVVIVNDANGGAYSNGQIRFNLASLSSGSEVHSIGESFVQFPYVVRITSSSNVGAAFDFMASLKDGSYSVLDSFQFELGNKQLLQPCSGSGIPIHYELMSKMSASDLAAQGASILMAPDSTESFTYVAGAGECNGRLFHAAGAVTNDAETLAINHGLLKRAKMTSNAQTATRALYSSSVNTVAAGRSHIDPTSTQQNVIYHIMCTIRLRDLGDVFRKIPLCRKPYMSLLLNIHQTSGAGVSFNYDTGDFSALSSSTTNGVLPVMLSMPATGGWTAAAETDINIKCGVMTAGGVQNAFGWAAAQFHSVQYTLKDSVADRYFRSVPSKQIEYDQLYHYSAQNVPAGSHFAREVQQSLAHMKWALIQVSLASVVNGAAAPNLTTGGVVAPSASPFSSAPMTCMPFASITNLQVRVSNVPVYLNPISYGWEQFQLEMAQARLNGNLELGNGSGLFDEKAWNEGYGYVFVNLDRVGLEDGRGKGLTIEGVNNSRCPIDIRVWTCARRAFTMSTTTSEVTQE